MRKSVIAAVVLAPVSWVWAAEGERPIHVESFLRLGWDDNVTWAAKNKVDSFFIREELALSLDKTYDTGFIGLRYRPALDWYENYGKDSKAEWSHGVDLNWYQALSRRFTVGISETFLVYDRSEVVDSDGVLRQPNYGYKYNTAAATLTALLTPKLRLSGSLRNQLFRYDDEGLAAIHDFDIWSYGLSFGTQVGKTTTVYLDGSIDDISYTKAGEPRQVHVPGYRDPIIDEVPNRDSLTYFAGLGIEQVFSPNLLGRLRGGYTYKDMEAANQSNDSAPYGEAALTIIPVPTTRLTLAASYSLYQSGLATFASQTRTTFSASLAHDLTARITLSVIGTYFISEYDAENSVDLLDPTGVRDGEESAATVTARASYRLDRNNWLDVGYTFSRFDSDFQTREAVERNRVDVGWRIRL